MKTRLGISVGLLGAALYFAALLGGLIPVLLLAGYVLLREENEWLRRTAVKAVAVLISIAFLVTLIGLIPDLLSWIASLVTMFDGNFDYSSVSKVISLITDAIGILRTCLFLVLGVKALNQGTVSVPVVDSLINKYM